MSSLIVPVFLQLAAAAPFDPVATAYAALPPAAATPELVAAWRWPGGTRARFRQTVGGLPVEGADLVVGVDPGGRARAWGRPLGGVRLPADALVSADDAAKAATTLSHRLGRGALWPPRVEAVAALREGALRRAWAVDVSVAQPPATWRVLVDAGDGRILRARPTSFAAEGNVYPASPANSELTRVPLQGLVGSGALSGERVEVYTCSEAEISDTLFGMDRCWTLAREATPDLDGNYLFEPAPGGSPDPLAEVQVYHHVDRVAGWFDASYGFAIDAPIRGIVNFPMTNAFFGDFDGDGVPDLSFGHSETGVDFGYDADVVYHEYGHAVIAGIADVGFLDGDAYGLIWDGGSLNEGAADWWSMALTGDPLTGEYAGQGLGRAAVRDLEPDRRCPDDLKGEVHADGEILGALGWNLMSDPLVGQQVAADLLFGAASTWGPDTRWPDAGVSLLDAAAELLGAGAIDGATHDAIVAHVEAANLVECGRVVPLDDGRSVTQFLWNAGLGGDLERLPAGVGFSVLALPEALAVEVSLSDWAASSDRMGWALYGRWGAPVEHRVVDLVVLGITVSTPDVFDVAFEGVGDAVLEIPARPGETLYLSLASRNRGGIDVLDFQRATVSLRAAPVVPERRGGCGCGGGEPALAWPLALLALARRRR